MGKRLFKRASCMISIIIIASMGCGEKVSDANLAVAARNVADNFEHQLKTELYAAIQDSGIVRAVAVCSQKGPELAAEFSSMPGWTVRRVSIKFRNPDNKADAFEAEALKILEDRPTAAGDEYFRWEEMDGRNVFRYMRAIRVKATCLNCHGSREKFSDDLKAILDEKYPDDHAVGFSLDDYRGAYSIMINWPDGKAAVDSILAGI